MELDALAVAEKAGQAEAEGLRAALAGAETVRKNLEEAKQRELEEIQSRHQEQVNTGVRGAWKHFRAHGPADPWGWGRTWEFDFPQAVPVTWE